MIRSRKDVQLLTFSVDDNPHLVVSYMKEKKYSFPVIVDKFLTERLFPVYAYPSSYIIDARGYRSSDIRFVDSGLALAELEKAAGEK